MTEGRYIHIDEVRALVDEGVGAMIVNSSWERQIARGHLYAIAHGRGQQAMTESKKLRAANRDCGAMWLLTWEMRDRPEPIPPVGRPMTYHFNLMPWLPPGQYKITYLGGDTWHVEVEDKEESDG